MDRPPPMNRAGSGGGSARRSTLPLGRERQALQGNEAGGHHVIRQPFQAEVAQARRQRRGVDRHHVREEARVARRDPHGPPRRPAGCPGARRAPLRPRRSRRGTHESSPGDRRGPETRWCRPRAASAIAGPEHPGVRQAGEGVRNEPFGRQVRAIQVAAREAVAADIQLSRSHRAEPAPACRPRRRSSCCQSGAPAAPRPPHPASARCRSRSRRRTPPSTHTDSAGPCPAGSPESGAPTRSGALRRCSRKSRRLDSRCPMLVRKREDLAQQ